MLSNYQPIGKYIKQIDRRNKDASVKRLMGINIDKYFMPSVANVVGTDLANYKIVSNNQFACNFMHVGRDKRLPVALLKSDESIIVSPAYFVFEISCSELLPDYLMLCFKRKDFDRNAWFYTDADVRGGMDKQAFLEMCIPVPSISEQRRIVSEYQTVERRIANNEALIQKLEETAQAIYHHTFVEGIDEENLPKGWKKGTLSDIMVISSGKTVSNKVDKQDMEHPYPVAGASGIIGYSTDFNKETKILTTGRVGTLGVINKYHGCVWAADNVLIAESAYYEYSYHLLKSVKYNEIAKGGVQALLTQTELKAQTAIIPPTEKLEEFECRLAPLCEYQDVLQEENIQLRKLLTLLTSKLA